MFETLIDTEDLPKLDAIPYKWTAGWHVKPKCYFVKTTICLGKYDGRRKYTSLLLHRIIMEQSDTKMLVDHINHDTLDNRKCNLRVTDMQHNSRHREHKNSNNKSGYRNVCWNKDCKKWQVQLQIDGRNTALGLFDDVDEAGQYAEEMREKYYGEFAGAS